MDATRLLPRVRSSRGAYACETSGDASWIHGDGSRLVTVIVSFPASATSSVACVPGFENAGHDAHGLSCPVDAVYRGASCEIERVAVTRVGPGYRNCPP